MPDTALDENKGKSSDEIKHVRTYRSCLEQSVDFCRPQFQKSIRMYRLFRGIPPPEIAGTFSQVMLGIAHAIIDEELPISMRGMLSQKNWLSLSAESIELEPHRKTAEKWVRHEIEKVQQMSRFAVWPIQAAHIFGNGFRWYNHRYIQRKKTKREPITGLMGAVEGFEDRQIVEDKSVITGSYINNFNVFPSPVGTLINTPDYLQDLAMQYLIIQTYPTRAAIENEVRVGNFDAKAVGYMFKKGGLDPKTDPSAEFKNEILGVDNEWSQFSSPDWMKKLKDEEVQAEDRCRVAWFLRRDVWCAIGDDKHLLYHGPPMFDGWPLANFKSSHDLDNFFGISILEVVEDLIVSMILNFNMQMDYLAGKFHPTTYMPQLLVDQAGGDMGAFDPSPYKIIPYQHKAFPEGIGSAIYHDSLQEMDRTSFMQQGEMKQYLEDIISQHGGQQMAGSTATVGEALINKSVARSMLRAINLDCTGIHDCVDITLRLGKKYRTQDEYINTGADGIPWEKIDHEAITDGYGITINGARSMMQAEEIFKKQMAIAPLMLGDPEIRGQIEMKRQLIEGAQFDNPDLIMNGNEVRDPRAVLQTQEGAEGRMPGGIPSLQNQMASVAGRSDGVTPRDAGMGNLV